MMKKNDILQGLILCVEMARWLESGRKVKHVLFVVASIAAFLILMLYLIEILTSDGPFDFLDFAESFMMSFPFLLLLTFIDYKVVSFFNRAKIFSGRLSLRILAELFSIVALAVLFVFVGNMPFDGAIKIYTMSDDIVQSMVAATLTNTFTVMILEYFFQLRKNQELARQNMQVRYNELKGQINPHFLFNSLNILVSLINRDPQSAVKYTKKLSDVYRYVLVANEQDVISLDEEMKFISAYIGILGIRYGSGFAASINVRDSDLCRNVVPLSLQVAVENAVKHNAVSEQKPLEISITSDGDYLLVTNSLNRRSSVDAGTGIGLSNLDKKYFLISGRHIEAGEDKDNYRVKLPLL